MPTGKTIEDNACKIGDSLKNVCDILGRLLNSASLDEDVEANDCLDVFDQYDWIMKPGSNEGKFKRLLEKGKAGNMAKAELDEFITMVSGEGEFHLYFTIYQGQQALIDCNELMRAQQKCVIAHDTYSVVALCTSHLSELDKDAIHDLRKGGNQMILKRDTGFFVKLYDEIGYNLYDGFSDGFKNIVKWAHEAGFRMIEFDGAAEELSIFPVYD